jgi:hypothetical protein
LNTDTSPSFEEKKGELYKKGPYISGVGGLQKTGLIGSLKGGEGSWE